ncbi:hypothetical protein [Desulfoscipio sp. XC116]|uniref:hypothetical protein n=1 Tax=Desulfoscipio sp. XC116 TaxID=3144975 RepID=UPI00325AFDFF
MSIGDFYVWKRNQVNNCKGPFRFSIAEIQTDLYQENEQVYISAAGYNPSCLEIRKKNNDLLVGKVPSSYAHIWDCIRNGWFYSGKIFCVYGNQHGIVPYVEFVGRK